MYTASYPPAALSAHHTLEDQDLILRAGAGDDRAFEALFARHRDSLRGFLYRKLRNREEAEDAVTITFCNAWRARDSFRGDASGKAWLYRIATRVAVDIIRRRGRRPAEEALDARCPEILRALEDECVEPATQILEAEWADETREAVQQAIARLTPEQRRLLTLYYFDGRNYDEISSLLGISYTKIRGRLRLIRERIRRDMVDRQCWRAS
jgi:RNA polymerase sigma-70 factor, ECF subfamily